MRFVGGVGFPLVDAASTHEGADPTRQPSSPVCGDTEGRLSLDLWLSESCGGSVSCYRGTTLSV